MRKPEEIEITFQPVKKIIIHDCIKLPIADFLKRIELMAISGQPVALCWAEGIVFLPLPYHPSSDIVIEDTLKGTLHWSAVIFSVMPEYQAIKKFGAREIPIIDQSAIPHFKQVARWLKKR